MFSNGEKKQLRAYCLVCLSELRARTQFTHVNNIGLIPEFVSEDLRKQIWQGTGNFCILRRL